MAPNSTATRVDPRNEVVPTTASLRGTLKPMFSANCVPERRLAKTD